MGILNKTPWYAAGLAFECTGCGRCCAGPAEGYVWVNEAEIAQIADFLGMDMGQFHHRYLRRVGNRFSIIERDDNHDCIFLTPGASPEGGKGCSVYSVRPTQCRTWPFWRANVGSRQAWAMAQDRCPGINRGPLHDLTEMQRRVKATGD